MKYYFILIFSPLILSSQSLYNYPDIDWQTIETEHFNIHFYSDTELLAREAAGILEYIYPSVTELYQYETKNKTHIIFTDVEDVSNGAAYYYDNKIIIWASPLDIALRGSHKWLENVLTHEFIHIISIQKAMKAGTIMPGAFFQLINYEKETHKNVLYGYPNAIVSYPIPGSVVPPWLAEGVSQHMYANADWDTWDSHRDMILRDRALHDKLFTFTELNTFGKSGIGNESVYNSGYAFVNYIVDKFGEKSIRLIMEELSKPLQYSISKAIKKAVGVDGKKLYDQYLIEIEDKYKNSTESINSESNNYKLLQTEGTTNLYPKWSNDGTKFAYISNKGNDYFSQTNLYTYDFGSAEEKKIAGGVQSAPSWGAGDSVLFYSKKPPSSSWKGYHYFDLYSYNIKQSEEKRLTKSARAVSPVYINHLKSIAYIAMDGGKQSIYLFSLDTEQITQLKSFTDSRILHNLYYDEQKRRILFDYTTNHFRNIAALNIIDKDVIDIVSMPNVDERDVSVSASGYLLYASDSNGIFNIVLSDSTSTINYTNVAGGAFMPDINKNGQILFSLYQDGGYKIAIIDTPKSVKPLKYKDIELIEYQSPINNPDKSIAKKYHDNLAQMFIMPRIMIDYGTIKPGIYFFSSEILEKLSISGGATVNFDKDIDFGFNLTYRKLFPTIYTEFFYVTRNTVEKSKYSVYDINDNLKFRIVIMRTGVKLPFLGADGIELYAQAQRYRAFIKENIVGINQKFGVAYDYYQGVSTGLKLGLDAIKFTVDRDINPSSGYRLNTEFRYEINDFFDGLDLSDIGTLTEVYVANNYLKIDLNGSIHKNIYPSKRWTLNFAAKGGWLSNTKVDSFFNYYGGGLDGIQGYPFYSFEGTNSLFSEVSLRIPLFRQVHIPVGWIIWQNATIGLEYQLGDTWTDEFNLKQSVGLQLRLSGYSFYSYPTAVGFEVHRGLTEFTEINGSDEFNYGNENRYYLTLLFGF